jgi:hypothetical protein
MRKDFYIENEVYIVIPKEEFEVAILAGESLSLNSADDNVDVEIRLKDGRLLTATFFTIQNIKSLFEKNKQSGECGAGLYFYCTDMILLEELTVENIVKTIEDLIKEGTLESTFKIPI